MEKKRYGKKILDFKNREINYRKNIEYFLDEVQQGKNVYIDKNKLKYEIFLENKIVGVYYYFSGTSFWKFVKVLGKAIQETIPVKSSISNTHIISPEFLVTIFFIFLRMPNS